MFYKWFKSKGAIAHHFISSICAMFLFLYMLVTYNFLPYEFYNNLTASFFILGLLCGILGLHPLTSSISITIIMLTYLSIDSSDTGVFAFLITDFFQLFLAFLTVHVTIYYITSQVKGDQAI